MIIVSDTSALVCLLHLDKINLLKDLFVSVIISLAVNENFLRTNSFIPIKGISGVLLQAKERRLITQIKPLINKLQTEINFRINNKLLRKILIEANEL